MASIRDNAQARFNFLFEKKTTSNLKYFTGKFGYEDPNDPAANTRVVEEPLEKPFNPIQETGHIVQQAMPSPEKYRPYIHFINLSKLDVITLPWIPENISYESKSNFVAIPSIGRNTPFYHYTGSEDSLEFNIDWFFTDDESRKKAYINATRIEALTKSDGYDSPPPLVKLVWGQSNIYANSIWIVESAPYKISQWLNKAMVEDLFNLYMPLQYKEYGLMPQQIMQEVTLKRVSTHNLKHEDVIFNPGSFNISGTSFNGRTIL